MPVQLGTVLEAARSAQITPAIASIGDIAGPVFAAVVIIIVVVAIIRGKARSGGNIGGGSF